MRVKSDPTPLPIGGILAGGRGRRFGGLDKGFLELQGRPLIDHVIARITPQVRALLINTNSTDSRYDAFGLKLCGDASPSTAATGPLVGLTSVFDEIEKRGDDRSNLLSVPVDTPFLPRNLLHRLSITLATTESLIAYAATAERDHPIIALWGPCSHDPVRRLFNRQPNISLHALMTALDAERVLFTQTPSDPFFNINSPRDLEAAERMVGSLHSS